ncbi:hypothetical protein M569_06634 [Genlisea aurea]|uniref:PB1 domain-containing protein n=1 Tax=Genlisea aurea TaxID=192259 RepID=S8CLW1_9LAMI|nr:hypothetical protein M569_06634 [Genlisea aurea]
MASNNKQVHKQGSALGRSVDLSKFADYEELISELDALFDFDGELVAKNKSWLIVYTDDEDDMMLVGDDPWEFTVNDFVDREFCNMARKIVILSRETPQLNLVSKIAEISSSVTAKDAE